MAIADIAVIAIILFAALTGLALGVTRVVLGLCGWAGATLAAAYGFPFVRPIARSLIESTLIADVAAAVTLFVVALIVLTAVSHVIGERVSSSGFGSVNRSLGLIVGLVIGAIVVSGGFLVVERTLETTPDRNTWPGWMQRARTATVVERGADLISMALPREWRNPGRPTPSTSTPKDTERAVQELLTPQRKVSPDQQKSGYNRRERLEMDRLFRGHEQEEK